MRSAPVIVWVLATALGLAALTGALSSYHRASARTDAELRSLEMVRALTGQVAALAQSRGPGPARPPSLAQSTAAALAHAGVAASVLVGVSPGQDVLMGSQPPVVRQRAAATLEGLTLPELGRVIDVWRRADSGWTLTGLDLTPVRAGPEQPGADLPLRVTLSAEAWSSPPGANP